MKHNYIKCIFLMCKKIEIQYPLKSDITIYYAYCDEFKKIIPIYDVDNQWVYTTNDAMRCIECNKSLKRFIKMQPRWFELY